MIARVVDFVRGPWFSVVGSSMALSLGISTLSMKQSLKDEMVEIEKNMRQLLRMKESMQVLKSDPEAFRIMKEVVRQSSGTNGEESLDRLVRRLETLDVERIERHIDCGMYIADKF